LRGRIGPDGPAPAPPFRPDARGTDRPGRRARPAAGAALSRGRLSPPLAALPGEGFAGQGSRPFRPADPRALAESPWPTRARFTVGRRALLPGRPRRDRGRVSKIGGARRDPFPASRSGPAFAEDPGLRVDDRSRMPSRTMQLFRCRAPSSRLWRGPWRLRGSAVDRGPSEGGSPLRRRRSGAENAPPHGVGSGPAVHDRSAAGRRPERVPLRAGPGRPAGGSTVEGRSPGPFGRATNSRREDPA